MQNDSPQLPPKPEVAMALLQAANSVYVHLDPRGEEVLVPSWFKTQPQLVLQVGLNMAVPIVDLDVGEDAISCTLSFNRTPHYCKVPWAAIYGLVGDDGRGMIWPDSVPPEVAAAADGRASGPGTGKSKKPKLQVASEGSEAKAKSKPKARAKPKAPRVAPAADPLPPPEKKDVGAASPERKPAPKRELPPYLRVVK